MKIFIAGPMTGIPEYNFPAFFEAQAKLEALGYEVANPADTGVREGWGHRDYLRVSVPMMLQCDSVAALPGWDKSVGCTQYEFPIAGMFGMEIEALETVLARGPIV